MSSPPGLLTWAFIAAAATGSPEATFAPSRSQGVAETLRAIPADPLPPALTNDKHYLTSNERRLDFFAEHVADHRQVYVGVGTDQNYVLAAWARAELIVVIDFDQAVVDLHGLYVTFLAEAATSAAFSELWHESGTERARKTIARAFPDDGRKKTMLALYEEARPAVARRLEIMQAKLQEFSTPWFMNDEGQYRHLHALALAGKIMALRGDFTERGVLRSLGDTLSEAGLEVGVLYLSNIEQYFMYGKAYRANIRGLPFATDAVVLRTLPGRPAGFEYIVQSAANFEVWISNRRTWSVYTMRGLAKGQHLTASQKHIITTCPPRTRGRSCKLE